MTTYDLWVLFASILVFLMQVGFLFLETGSVQKRNRPGIAIKNIIMLLASTVCFIMIGYRLMYGTTVAGVFGWSMDRQDAGVNLLYQTGFAAVAATIISGAIAERTRLIPNVLAAALMALFVYPIFGHWIWHGGWLDREIETNAIRVYDFAGGSAVHFLGGIAALVGAKIAGPRYDRFEPHPQDANKLIPRPMGRRDLPLVSVGLLFLWIGWIGFNGGAPPEEALSCVPNYVQSTCIAAGAGAFITIVIVRLLYTFGFARRKFEPFMTVNGTMGGMVAITGCCALVTDTVGIPLEAAFVGAVGGIAVLVTSRFVLYGLGIDDPLDAVAVHAGAGAVGILMCPLLDPESSHLLHQIVGLACAACLSGGAMWVLFTVFNGIGALRTDARIERIGLTFTGEPPPNGLPPVKTEYLESELQHDFRQYIALVTAMPLHELDDVGFELRALRLDIREHLTQRDQRDDTLDDLIDRVPYIEKRIRLQAERLARLSHLTKEHIHIEELLGRLNEALEPAKQRHPLVQLRIINELPHGVAMVGQVILLVDAIRALITNAIRHSDAKRLYSQEDDFVPRVQCSFLAPPIAGSDETSLCSIVVRDNGTGVRRKAQKWLGEPFSPHAHGFGLGLFMARFVANTYGGELSYSPREDPSSPWISTFVLTMQLSRVA